MNLLLAFSAVGMQASPETGMLVSALDPAQPNVRIVVDGSDESASARSTMSRMNAERLEQAQMRIDKQAQTKGEAATTPVMSDLLTVEEAAAYLRISRSQLYALTRTSSRVMQRHPIPVIRFGKSLKFRKSSLDGWLTQLEKSAAG
jgi:excisionase family DNA binding protein